MALTLFIHPLSSFCHKVLFPLYENETPCALRTVDLQDKVASAYFFEMWPMGKIPVLRDDARGVTLPETTIMLEYLDKYYPGAIKLFPKDEEQCRQARLWDRTLDLYLHVQMQKIVNDRARPEGTKDATGVADATKMMHTTYDMLERQLAGRRWILGDSMSIADCAALPALFYGNVVVPFTPAHKNIAAYFERLMARPSVQRVMTEAKPFFKYFPYKEKLPARYLEQ